ncbi:MAG: carbamoyl-phosphate synthase large subunit, partial [Planctomycetes bacterium]|nr:carbamoyl-phosphate synthase large subunit [Planctomycetota bacterium]
MPKRTDIHNILIIGSGPIVIGQGCEFDYSGTQACKALREEGYSVVLINSNPATIMTDPDLADQTYIEPITPEFIEKILIRERKEGRPVHALLPTLGGQTGLNCAMECHESGILDRHGVEMIGASAEAIHRAEDRTAFKETMLDIGLEVPHSGIAHSWEEAREIVRDVKLPCCVRPAYTLGGEGGGFCRTMDQLEAIAKRGLQKSRVSEILIEEDLTGWKEFELELMRDGNDNVVIICSIENFDPMGVHTGDSITVAPVQTLSDKEYQMMRDDAIAIIRAIGVDTGGCNIQFAVEPDTGRQLVIEMNPRVSRSSALASKATGYPIARIAAKLAVGYTLDELPNDITGTTPASFEPTLDYVVVKMPRWTFEKFPDCDETLGTQMKSIGEAMAIGRTFKEAFQKCIRSMEIQRHGFGLDNNDAWLNAHRRPSRPRASARVSSAEESIAGQLIGGSTATEAPPDTQEEHAGSWPIPDEVLREKLSVPCQGRPHYIRYAFKMGWTVEQVHKLTRIDPWFLDQLLELVEAERGFVHTSSRAASADARQDGDDQQHGELELTQERFLLLKQLGYSDSQIAAGSGHRDLQPADTSTSRRAGPVYKLVDTCAAEFEAQTPYYYSTYETPFHTVESSDPARAADEIRVTDRPKIIILGGGPNRIGQGIEFDYCCCHAAFAARKAGYETVMINSNPETVSTDFDTSDMLFFEPLTHEDVLNIIERLNGRPLVQSGNGELGTASGDSEKDQAEGPSQLANQNSPSASQSAFRDLRPSGLVQGVIVQFGGQTPLNLAQRLKDAGVPIVGTQPERIHMAEDREQFQKVLRDLSLLQPANGIARSRKEAQATARRVGFPVLVRPGYVLGGRGMKICNNEEDLDAFLNEALEASDREAVSADNPVLIDKFLADAIEVDVDAVADFGHNVRSSNSEQAAHPPKPMCMVCGIMEHIEEAGIHSGDSTCVLPPFSLGRMVIEELFRSTRRLAERLEVCGAMNVQYAVLNRTVYVLEVNPRASRTLPFVAKATGVPWAQVATQVMLGEPLKDVLASLDVTETPWPGHTAVKAPVFPFDRLGGVDVILGPEMRSTGEVMAIDSTFGRAFAKAQVATGLSLPTSGNVLISVNDPDKPRIVSVARDFHDLGFTLYSTTGTRKMLAEAGIPSVLVSKSTESGAPFLKDLIEDGTLDLLINTPIRTGPASAEGRWRSAAFARRIPLITT